MLEFQGFQTPVQHTQLNVNRHI